ncbi:hypothetical protein ANANG_G00206930 [Anguilla anguilla]|uniref:Secreted protein n=1 Tax=Anguilla anguilla TaxID=7936 RepID=A0A9D3LZ35_ANGAN|nr:hypothetical protein ANANG_G00206930 [Anguilla anguilla]
MHHSSFLFWLFTESHCATRMHAHTKSNKQYPASWITSDVHLSRSSKLGIQEQRANHNHSPVIQQLITVTELLGLLLRS